MALIWDNCGPHGTHAVNKALREAGITVFMLPPNTTDKFQVCDLVVNRLFKSKLRRLRADALLGSFREWRTQYLAAKAARKYATSFTAVERADPLKQDFIAHVDAQAAGMRPWAPPCPPAAEGLATLMMACQALVGDQYQQAISTAFIRLGLAPREDNAWLKLLSPSFDQRTSSDQTKSLAAEDAEDIQAVDILGVCGLLAVIWDSNDSDEYDVAVSDRAANAIAHASMAVAGSAALALA